MLIGESKYEKAIRRDVEACIHDQAAVTLKKAFESVVQVCVVIIVPLHFSCLMTIFTPFHTPAIHLHSTHVHPYIHLTHLSPYNLNTPIYPIYTTDLLIY